MSEVVPPPAGARAGTESPRPTPAQERVADFVHGALLQHIVMADRKAGILFTILSAALLFMVTRIPAAPLAWPGLMWVGVTAVLVAAAAGAFAVVLPRTSARGTFLYWGTIAGYPDRDSFVTAVCRHDGDALARAKLAYCHDLARVCAHKFRLLRLTMAIAAAGLVLFLVNLAVETPGATAMPPNGQQAQAAASARSPSR